MSTISLFACSSIANLPASTAELVPGKQTVKQSVRMKTNRILQLAVTIFTEYQIID